MANNNSNGLPWQCSGGRRRSVSIGGVQRWRWYQSIVHVVLLAASSECLMKGTNFAFVHDNNLHLHHRHHPRPNCMFAELSSASSSHPSDGRPSSDDYYLTPGKPSSYFVVERYDVPSHGFPTSSLELLFEEADVRRLNMTTENVTLPSALAMLDPGRYPDLKSSLGAARDGSILVRRHGQQYHVNQRHHRGLRRHRSRILQQR